MTDKLVQELLDREAIKELKARYWRAFDTKDWPLFRSVFTDDCRFELVDLNMEPVVGADTFINNVVMATQPMRSVHHGHQSEITF